MKKLKFDIIIIGGGIMGLSTLYHLVSKTNLKVALVEKSRLGSGSTNKSGGFVRSFHTKRREIDWSIDTLNFLRDHKSQVDFNPIGSLFMTNLLTKNVIESLVDTISKKGENINLLQRNEFNEFIPNLVVSEDRHIISEPNAGYADPLRTCLLYAELSKRNGAYIFECAEVKDIILDDKLCVYIDGIELITEAVHVSVGAWSSSLLKKVGLSSEVFSKGIQADTFYVDNNEFSNFCLLDSETDIYTRPYGPNQQLIGSATEFFNIKMDAYDKPDERQCQKTLSKLNNIFEVDIKSLTPIGGRVGFDGYNQEMRGKIYQSDIFPGISVSEGWSGAGFKLAHGAGKSASKIILESLHYYA
ncbi:MULTISPECIES: NAD(P)/FAD-dependent oxidoreductase [Psychrobacter]|uniref:Monomeric sarcosine oxidase n=2 Tax=Psychrobacter TaxID=497 RepID=A0A1R4GZE2_9GAMM|nr:MULTISPECIES: FAD-dependent oxidoreductase [Psychrobacter]SJM38500.1 Monomeric sarcosine oxidase [Psychrobacter pasteurii]SJM73162.1 Monomeric sarcosine oxidase [Psychrobacter piechaudii]